MAAKAEQIEGEENPRHVITHLSGERWPARALYEELYCARGEMENRIKEPLSLFAARVSAETMQANQVRLNLTGCAYVLLHARRRLGLKGTGMERAKGDDPAAAAEDRGADSDQTTPHLAVDGVVFSARGRVPAGVGATALLRRVRCAEQGGTETRF